jgi:thiosulfate/3-mercaptopyruvate sulfurtransferase
MYRCLYNHIRLVCLGLTLAGIGASACAHALPGPVVTPQWLHEHQAQVQVLDVRDDMNSLTSKPSYSMQRGQKVLDQVGGHIPDALSANFWALRESRQIGGKKIDFLLPTAEEFQAVMRASQLEADKPVVLVPTGDDAASLQEAAFLAWELMLFGMPSDQVAILDGGMHAWLSAGYEVDDDAIAPMSSGHWSAQAPRAELLATAENIQRAGATHAVVLDARPIAQFAGLERPAVIPQAGRLPGASALPAELMYVASADGAWHFLARERYQQVFALRGMPHLGAAILYCNTGQYAAGAWYALARIVGMDGLREYPGGLNEWVQRGMAIESP